MKTPVAGGMPSRNTVECRQQLRTLRIFVALGSSILLVALVCVLSQSQEKLHFSKMQRWKDHSRTTNRLVDTSRGQSAMNDLQRPSFDSKSDSDEASTYANMMPAELQNTRQHAAETDETGLQLGKARKYLQRMDWLERQPKTRAKVSIIGDSISSGCCCEQDINGNDGKYFQIAGPDGKRKYYAGNGFAQRLHDSSDMNDYDVKIIAGSGRTAIASTDKCHPLVHHEHDGGTVLGSNHPTVWQDIRSIISENPDVVLIMLGTNDAYTDWNSCQSKFVTDYTKLIQVFKRIPDPPRIRLLIPPIFKSNLFAEQNPQTEIIKSKLPQKIREIARANGLPDPVDLQSLMIDMDSMGKNGIDIHPTCKGHRIIEDKIMETVFGSSSRREDMKHMAHKHTNAAISKFQSYVQTMNVDITGTHENEY
eukprot:SAG31_NODE_820_length_11808_cov_16.331540_17_plen_422_part_00